jgi:predicted unusual protein kinase regulating ubiquinone biosynthesis (AarF/ABC1/UbiB family)
VKIKTVILGSLAILSVGGYLLFSQHSIPSKIKPTPLSNQEVKAELEVYPFDQAVLKSDLIVRVKIKDKVGLIDGPIPKTTFEANVEEIITDKSNKSPKTVKIMQQGSEQVNFNGNELFKKNEEVILFLMEAKTVENAYWILGEETNIYKVLENEVTKYSLKDKQLEDITKKSYLSDKKDREFQVMDREKFVEKIKSYKTNK